MNNVKDETKPVVSFRPQDLTVTGNGIGVDTSRFNSCSVVLEVGAVSGSSPTLDIKIQESDDNSSFSDVVGATFVQVTGADNSQELAVENLNTTRKKFLRAVATVAGGSPSFIASVVFVLGRAEITPA